ncbi:synaptobrevin-like protein YKT6 [Gregarina niphandrodes]|uniref:Synaptobrevin-like protein YKT6 n=1 Tax=Gregarina niphandrodes TaxID=110365 RepID=A0A023AWU6_GRENI|nr:synaptobrevin-like protein YKT6 [Gregarina niphandrodes]EZG43221.1 synaptobrevin-like protein YKT6 [Gregarina niphandrodes]|eukprot:XP_011133521.1 synaptobrevin-like protein YKT6 [Gregarina niphandrodes]
MGLISLLIFHVKEAAAEPTAFLLSKHLDLSQFNFFMRSTIAEHVVFHSRLIAARTPVGQRQSIKFDQDIGMCHSYVHQCGLGGTVISDCEYPPRVAFVLLNRALSAFVTKYPPEQWERLESDPPASQFAYPEGSELLANFQDPKKADDLSRIQEDLKEVHNVMVVTMEKLLQRGENLDILMTRTTDLSAASEKFYRQAKAQNQCCKWY